MGIYENSFSACRGEEEAYFSFPAVQEEGMPAGGQDGELFTSQPGRGCRAPVASPPPSPLRPAGERLLRLFRVFKAVVTALAGGGSQTINTAAAAFARPEIYYYIYCFDRRGVGGGGVEELKSAY